jgi:hypothetical protein
MTRYRKSWTQVLGEVREGTEVKEVVVVEADYKYNGKVVKISKKNFSKVHKDYKNSTRGKETMLINDPKTNGSISVPVQFEEVDWDRFKIDESWKKGTYTITDVKTGKVLGKFKSGAKAQKAADDIFQKGDYDAVSVEVDEGVEIDEWVIEESAGLQLKMAFDDAGIKIKGVKSGKLVISKKDKKKVEDIIAKQMKKPADAKRVLGSQIVFEDVELAEKGTAYPATIDTLRMIVKDKQHQTVMFKSGKAIVDLFTASAMVQVYDALKKPDMKKHFEKMIGDKAGFMKTQAFAMKMIG